MRLGDREAKHSIEHQAAHLLMEDADWVIDHLPTHECR
jgi:hypothetical protein